MTLGEMEDFCEMQIILNEAQQRINKSIIDSLVKTGNAVAQIADLVIDVVEKQKRYQRNVLN